MTTSTITTDDLVTIEIMPEHLRDSHETAGYSSIEWCGQYPGNGAERSLVTRDEADELLEEHGEWARIIRSRGIAADVRVEGGQGADYDQGRVRQRIDGRMAEVAWDSGVVTEVWIDQLTVIE